MRSSHVQFLLGPAILTVIGLGGVCWAADAGPTAPGSSSNTALEEIVVTAEKRAENIQEVPISMTVVTGPAIAEFHENDLYSLENSIPNLYVERLNWADTIYLRGFGSSPGNYAFDPDVSLYEDGVYAGRPQQFGAPFFDVERVEVLRGPQGALFGKNTAAGAVSVVTANPTDTFQGSLTSSYNFDLRGTEINSFISGPLSDTVGARLAVRFLNEDGYIYNATTGDDNPRHEFGFGRLTLRYAPTESFDITGKVEYSNQMTNGENDVLAPLTTGQAVNNIQYNAGTAFGYKDTAYVRTFNGSLNENWRLGPDTLTFVTGYSTFRADRANTYSTDNPDWFTNLTLEDFKQVSQEVRLASPEHQILDYIVGGYVDWSKYNVGTPWVYDLFGGLAAGALNTFFSQEARTYSAFAQATYNATDALRFIGSLRYTELNKAGSLDTTLVSGIPIAGLESDYGDFSEHHLDPSITAQYDVIRHVMLYATYGQGSKSGGFVSNTPGTGQPDFQFKPEQSKNYEVGVKSTFDENKILVDISAFHTTIKNLQTSVFNTSNAGGFVIKNAGAATSRGIEASLAWKPIESLKLTWNGAYQDAKYDSFLGAQCLARQPISVCDPSAPPSAPNSQANNNLAGYPLSYSSKWNGQVEAQHSLPITADHILISTLRASYRSRYYDSDDQSTVYGIQPGFVKYDVRFEYAVGNRMSIALLGKNISDVHTYSFANAWTVTATPTAIKYLDEPRTITLEGTWRF
jgi:iron complex outermembrane receptor protein